MLFSKIYKNYKVFKVLKYWGYNIYNKKIFVINYKEKKYFWLNELLKEKTNI